MNVARRSTKAMSLVALTVGILLFVVSPPQRASAGGTTSDLEVIVDSSVLLGNYIQVEATMSGTLLRDDGSEGTYKVPITLLYPQVTAACNGAGILDVVNSVLYETYEFTGTGIPTDPFFPSLFAFARLILGDGYIQGNGYVYATGQWNKLVIERQRAAGALEDPSIHIDRGTDGYLVLRDLSRVLRTPGEFLTDAPMPCAVDEVMAFGFSQTGMLLRQFYFEGLNTLLAGGPAFDDGLVFEGSVHGVAGSHCRSLEDEEPWFSYSFAGCGGETPAAQGRVITVNSETDVQLINGWKARPSGDGDPEHYRLYEVAGTSHIWASLIPLKFLGIRPADEAEQNYADLAPLFRAMMDHLLDWTGGTAQPPPSAFLKGNVGRLAEPLFSSSSWGADNQQVFLTRLGEDENVLGGVRLPHVRTTLPGGQAIGGPLGIYRGTHCNNDPAPREFVLDCQLGGDVNIYNMAGGSFTPYAGNGPECTAFYPSHDSYGAAVSAAAEQAVAQGWVRAEEVASIVANAELKADEYPGCVPLG